VYSNLDRFKSLLDDESTFNISRTKSSERGKGLRLMSTVAKRDEIKKFTIVSNSIYANLSDKKIHKMKNSFK
jgi:hypothetical protein